MLFLFVLWKQEIPQAEATSKAKAVEKELVVLFHKTHIERGELNYKLLYYALVFSPLYSSNINLLSLSFLHFLLSFFGVNAGKKLSKSDRGFYDRVSRRGSSPVSHRVPFSRRRQRHTFDGRYRSDCAVQKTGDVL